MKYLDWIKRLDIVMTSPSISLIIPCFNEQHRVKESIEEIARFFLNEQEKLELLVVDDGSTDNTASIVRTLLASNPSLTQNAHLLEVSHKGKGWAVRNGILRAQGEYRFISDLDLSVSLTHIKDFVKSMENGADMVIASRQLKESQRLDEPKRRFFASRLFNQIIRCFLSLRISDSQCGFKGFTSATANAIFSVQCLNGYCFDPEVLFIAKKLHYTVIESPVIWRHQSASKVNLKVDSIKMIWDLLRIRVYSILGKYNQDSK